MPIPTVSFVLGVGVLFYLSTFVLFALLRIITGISIQRISYSGLRRVAFSPRDGISIRIRGIGFSLHRPTFSQPTWISLTVTEPRLIIDLAALRASHQAASDSAAKDGANGKNSSSRPRSPKGRKGRARMFTKLIEWKERIKKLHRQVDWFRQFDLLVLRASVNFKDVGSVRIERLMLSVDTRPKTVDRSRLFQHRQTQSDTQRPAEWRCVIRSLLLNTEGKDSVEIMDYATLMVHGFLVKELDGLRDASIALKVGRATIPFDEIHDFVGKLKPDESVRELHTTSLEVPSAPMIQKDGSPLNDAEIEPPEEAAVEVIRDSQEFASSILRGIHEIQLAVSFFGLSRRVRSFKKSGQDVYFNLAMKEVGLDLMRLDPKSPAHRQYFSAKDIAHQALLTAISIAAGLDTGLDHPERMVYVPMVTATIKTTLPSKVLQAATETDVHDKNLNILFANLVCTSPSIDLDPKHLPLILGIAKSKTVARKAKKPHKTHRSTALLAKLLPKAIVKVAIQEPVIRVSLPRGGKESEYDMIISSVSSMAMDIDAQHNLELKHHYSLSVDYRHTHHRLYGQTPSSVRHELLFADTVEFKIDVNALPEIDVLIAGKFEKFSLFLTEPEICEGLRQIVVSMKKELISYQRKSVSSEKHSFLRRVPSWLHHVQIEGSDFDVEITAVEPTISKYARGVSFHLNSWTLEHKINREEMFHSITRRRSSSRVSNRDHSPRHTSTSSPRRRPASPTDGRRLAVHIDGLEGLIIDSIHDSTGDPFLNLPSFEVAFSTSTDAHGPLMHINAKIEKLYILYSLYNAVALGIAFLMTKSTFMPPVPSQSDTKGSEHVQDSPGLSPAGNRESVDHTSHVSSEIVTIDFRAGLIQVKGIMPADPSIMIQTYAVEGGRHRWASPFVKAKLFRLYAATPGMPSVWSRVVSTKVVRLDIRPMKKKVGTKTIEEKSFDVTADGIRISVPHQLIVHAIFDNVVNVAKTHQQLHHQFIKGERDFVLTKHPEGPKHVPKISLRTGVLIFEIEDSPFEYKLGLIYRSGLLEQHQRLAREDAFRLKVKHMNTKRSGKNGRARSAHPAPRDDSSSDTSERPRSRSVSAQPSLRKGERRGRLRYDTKGRCEMAGSINCSITQARDTLHKFNAASWKRRIDRTWAAQRCMIKEIRSFFAGIELPEEEEESEPIMALHLRPGLATICLSDLSFNIDKPSFPLTELPAFMQDVGKGIPVDTKYGLLVPLHVHITMGEARAVLRDYPLPLLHIPAIRSGQSSRLPSFSLTTNFVIAEEFRDKESQRLVKVTVMPKSKQGPDEVDEGYHVNVRRTISPVKTYSNMKIEINTSAPTRFTWSTAYQPAIQDMMQVIEGFTKIPMDPSEHIGFWDKTRLSFHSRILVSWKGDGDVHLSLKGSRDPYVVTGHGAGFVMVWRNDVCWKIAQDPDPRKFMTVDSGDYFMAIPDYDHYYRHALDAEVAGDDGSMSQDTLKSAAMFKKVIMKLSGNVQWLLGLMFEQSTEDGKRHFDMKNHWDIVLKHPDFAKPPPDMPYDAFRGFRSQHIHMSVAVAAPQSRDWDVQNLRPSDNYNSVHLSPRFFTHFIKWWHLFSGVLNLPIRQGPLWAATGHHKVSKKFGRHLATLKYNLLLSPVFISHMYKHKDIEDFSAESVAVTGLKMKIDSFMLDLHQRREYFGIPTHAGLSKRTSSMKINQAQVDLISADFRAVSASVRGTNEEDLDRHEEEGISTFQNNYNSVDLSRFTIPDNDFTWIDMDDFVELDWILPQESNPETKILPLGKTPRFTYFRNTDHDESHLNESGRTSPFGDEPTHNCIMTQNNDPRRVQADLIHDRLEKIVQQLEHNERAAGELELKVIRDAPNDAKMREKLETLKSHSEALKHKHAFLHGMRNVILKRLETDGDPSALPVPTPEPAMDRHESDYADEHMNEGLNSMKDVPQISTIRVFNNRFVVHNAQIKWNNSLRDIILRYFHQVGQRRGFIYYMSRRAVKFILDIIEDKKRADRDGYDGSGDKSEAHCTEPTSPTPDDEMTIDERIAQILADGRDFVEADDGERQITPANEKEDEQMSADFIAQNSYYFHLIAPQIQLQSEKNPKSAVLIAAKSLSMKVVQIMDKERILDEVSGLVQRRFNAKMDSMQIFVTSTKTFSTDFLHMYSGNRYGCEAGTFWPPWAPIEVMHEFSVNPYGFSRVIQRTSASLKFDKYNQLRLKYHDDLHKGRSPKDYNPDSPEHRMDHLAIEFPQFRAICDSSQYFAMYLIVVDVLLYSEPLEKTRSERLEKIMLASDFSDLTGAPEMIEMLQSRIRQLEEIKMHFQVHESLLDKQGWKDRIAMDRDLANCEDELFFMMKAITTSQQKTEDRGVQDGARGILQWMVVAKEVAWHLVREHDQKFLEFQIRDTSFERIDNSDGSNQNSVEFGRINGYNFMPNAIYDELIAPYVDEKEGIGETREKMLRIQWLMLEAIAGIPVVDYFEVDLVPVQVQLEKEVAKRLFEYIFPNSGDSDSLPPFMPKHIVSGSDHNGDEKEKVIVPTEPIPHLPPGEVEEAPHQGTGTGAGALERRLHPTLRLPEHKHSPKHNKHKGLGITESHNSLTPHFNIFQHRNKSQPTIRGVGSTPKAAGSSMTLTTLSRTPSSRSTEDVLLSDKKKSQNASTTSVRKSTEVARASVKSKSKDSDKAQSDDLTQMLNRASSYITLSYFHIHSLILCLSYKGSGKRNIEDVHDLVFRLPSIEYRNKTWSNLDLAMELKKDVLRALVGHAGRIVSNKFRGPTKKAHHKIDGIRESLLLSATNTRADGHNPRSNSDTGSLSSRPGSLSPAAHHDKFSRDDTDNSSDRHSPRIQELNGDNDDDDDDDMSPDERGRSTSSDDEDSDSDTSDSGGVRHAKLKNVHSIAGGSGSTARPPVGGHEKSNTTVTRGTSPAPRGTSTPELPSISLNGTPVKQGGSLNGDNASDTRSLSDLRRKLSSRPRSGSGVSGKDERGKDGVEQKEKDKDKEKDKKKKRKSGLFGLGSKHHS